MTEFNAWFCCDWLTQVGSFKACCLSMFVEEWRSFCVLTLDHNQGPETKSINNILSIPHVLAFQPWIILRLLYYLGFFIINLFLPVPDCSAIEAPDSGCNTPESCLITKNTESISTSCWFTRCVTMRFRNREICWLVWLSKGFVLNFF